jgi:hypothetical protein
MSGWMLSRASASLAEATSPSARLATVPGVYRAVGWPGKDGGRSERWGSGPTPAARRADGAGGGV